MLDQSNNLNNLIGFLLCFCFKSTFVPKNRFLNLCFIFSKNLKLSLMEKVTTGT